MIVVTTHATSPPTHKLQSHGVIKHAYNYKITRLWERWEIPKDKAISEFEVLIQDKAVQLQCRPILGTRYQGLEFVRGSFRINFDFIFGVPCGRAQI